MRLMIEISLKEEEFPLEFRALILSVLKNALCEYSNGEYLERYYSDGVSKPFSFSVWLGKSNFDKDKITIPCKRIKLYWSTGDFETGIIFYNALLMQKNKYYPLPAGNCMFIKRIVIEPEQVITQERIKVQFTAPLCVRQHDRKTNRDCYYSYEKDGFEENLQQVLRAQLIERNDKLVPYVNDFKLEAVQAKKTVVKHYQQFVESTLGIFEMQGHIALLTHFYLEGIGSRRSAGFGYFNIIE